MRLNLSAQVQSIIMAYARENPNEVMTLGMMKHNPSLVKIGAFDHHIGAGFATLTKSKLLVRVRMGVGRTKYGYELKDKPKHLAVPETIVTTNALPADIKLSVNKTDNSLNIEFKGIRLNISVV